MRVEYFSDRQISVDQFIELLKNTSLGNRRPLENRACLSAMLEQADILITAWVDDELIGLARSLTDFHFCCYLSELAVADEYQSQGVGKALVRRTMGCLEKGCFLTLLSAPQAVEYYPKAGFEKYESSWLLTDVEQLG